ncbi:MAG: hypothetical protein K8F31_05090 [Roseovarius sp.]|nr:hypothetical protein [Roseovarius sp.]
MTRSISANPARFFKTSGAAIAAIAVAASLIAASPASSAETSPATGPAPGAEEGDYFWSFTGADVEAAAYLAGCKQCDDIRLSLSCIAGDDQIILTPYMDIEQGEDMDTANVELNIDAASSFNHESFLKLNLMEDILQPIVEIKKADPLLGALVSGSELVISVRGQQDTYTLMGAGQAIGGMLDLCKKQPG